jgi:hypothetical protein
MTSLPFLTPPKAPQSEGRFRGLLVVLLQRFGQAMSLRAIIWRAVNYRV